MQQVIARRYYGTAADNASGFELTDMVLTARRAAGVASHLNDTCDHPCESVLLVGLTFADFDPANEGKPQ